MDPVAQTSVVAAISASEERLREAIDGLKADIINVISGHSWVHDSRNLEEKVTWKASDGQKVEDRVTWQDKPEVCEVDIAIASAGLRMPKETSMTSSNGVSNAAQESGMAPLPSSVSAVSIEQGWPANLRLRPEYFQLLETQAQIDETWNGLTVAQDMMEKAMKQQGKSTTMDLHNKTGASKIWLRLKQFEPRLIDPDSRRRLFFDTCSIFVLLFDVVYTPYSLTWDEVVPDEVSIAILLSSSSFWIIDMILNFFTGFYTSEGLVEMKFANIALRYVRGWFVIDASCIAGDLVNLFPLLILNTQSGQAGTVARVLRVVKLVRFLRVLGMFRMLKVMTAVNKAMEARLSETWKMFTRTIQITAWLVWLGHLCACAWYAVGRHGPTGDIGQDWTESRVGLRREIDFMSTSAWYQYVTSYQWALAQITLGAHDVVPVNSFERLFTICVNLFGLLFGGSLIAILSNTLIDLKQLNQEREQKIRSLKEFLIVNEVDMSVRMRIIRQVHDRIQHREAVRLAKDVTALGVLSRALLRDLRFCLFSRHVFTHSLFRSWTSLDEECGKHLCGCKDTESIVLLPDDELFQVDMEAESAYYIIQGTVEYDMECEGDSSDSEGESATLSMALSKVSKSRKGFAPSGPGSWRRTVGAKKLMHDLEEVPAGRWLCEATWWCHWSHVGNASTHDPCNLLCITPKAVQEAMHQNMAASAIGMEYARLLHQRLVNASAVNVPTDVLLPNADFTDLILSMPKEAHIVLGVAAMQHSVGKQPYWFARKIRSLEEEIRHGRSIVLLDKDWCLQRQVALALAKVAKDENSTLSQLAEYDEETKSWKARCQLPGAKQKLGEEPGQTIKRFLDQRFADCMPQVDDHAFTTRHDVEASARFGMGTTYIKSTFSLKCTPELEGKLLRNRCMLVASPRHKGDACESKTILNFSKEKPEEREREDLRQYLAEIEEAYVLRGTDDEQGLYVWMKDDIIEPLADHKDLVSTWLEAIESMLTQPESEGTPLDSEAGDVPSDHKESHPRPGHVDLGEEFEILNV